VSKNRRPRRAARLWLRYAGGAVGLAACSGWLLSHSKLMGSTDLDRWLEEGRGSTIAFWKDHVESPLLSIRDELFETFRKRHRGVMELEEVQLTANSFHRMLVAFTEQATGEKLPEGASDQEMMEIMMARYFAAMPLSMSHPFCFLFQLLTFLYWNLLLNKIVLVAIA
ncbi:protein DGS1, mitochondrial, partial [Cryptomeria japonica]|uniref:protein DGS1, mitochondrial n=1 Tax=Cryptomeria japonica TaxID=3369 RepID=UPI0027DA0630